uniref:Uncharacterized protein n=1 Tax=Arundo donax TaxID=35708 RepID=A0A0A9EKP9_ARUDO
MQSLFIHYYRTQYFVHHVLLSKQSIVCYTVTSILDQ